MENQIIKQQNDIVEVARIAPDAIERNQASCQACVEYGKKLLSIAEGGMNDEIDKQLEDYIKKSRVTITAMNDRRKPVTQLFDQIRSGFTQLETMIDPKVAGTPANKAQKLRDQYARKKYEEEERRRREAERMAQIERDKTSYLEACEKEIFGFFNQRTNQAINRLISLNSSLTYLNFDEVSAQIDSFDCKFPVKEISGYTFGVMLPSSLDMEEVKAIQKKAIDKGYAMMQQYEFDVQGQKDSIMQLLPSKYNELLAIEKQKQVDAEAAAAREEEMKRKEQQERERKEAERKAEEERKRQEEELKSKQSNVESLFSVSAVSVSSPANKVKVKKLVKVLNPKGYADLFNYWWVGEGQYLSQEELEKVFKKQISYAEKSANRQNPDYIKSDNLKYIDEIKAK